MEKPDLDKTLGSVSAFIDAWWLDIRAAAMFLTRIGGFGHPDKRPLCQSARAFPIVGALVGMAAGAGLLGGYALGLHPLACAMIGLAVSVCMTGALHEDGLADVADGFGGGKSPAGKLKIMRDSRIGVYGMLAVVFSVGLRAAILSGMITPWSAAAALVAAGASSRAAMVVVMARLDAARKDGLSAAAGRPEPEGVIVSLLVGGGLTVAFLGPMGGAAALVMAAAAAFIVAWLAQRQIGGHTGDVLGAVQQVCEIAILAAAAATL